MVKSLYDHFPVAVHHSMLRSAAILYLFVVVGKLYYIKSDSAVCQ